MFFSSENGWIHLDEKYRPIIIATWVGEVSESTFEEYLEHATLALIEKCPTTVFVIDSTECSAVPPRHRTLQSDWIRSHAAHIREHDIAVSFAFSTLWQRSIMATVHWLVKPPYSYNVAATRSGAIDWACAQLQERSLLVPDAIIDAFQRPLAPAFRKLGKAANGD